MLIMQRANRYITTPQLETISRSNRKRPALRSNDVEMKDVGPLKLDPCIEPKPTNHSEPRIVSTAAAAIAAMPDFVGWNKPM